MIAVASAVGAAGVRAGCSSAVDSRAGGVRDCTGGCVANPPEAVDTKGGSEAGGQGGKEAAGKGRGERDAQGAVSAAQDPYALLGVERCAAEKEIRSAY